MSNGGKITRWMIKYPHTKKNAQLSRRSLYPDIWSSLYTSMFRLLTALFLLMITLSLVVGYVNGAFVGQ